MKFMTALLPLLSGCCLAPDYIRPEIQHESHALQHTGSEPTHYGRDIAALTAIWGIKGVTLEVSEGYTFHGDEGVYEGCKAGREVFEARLGYNFRVPK